MNAIVLFNYSMIESLDDIEPFYQHLFGGKAPENTVENGTALFKSLGTCDPLASVTKRLGRSLAARMEKATGQPWTYYIGSKHTAPHMDDVAKQCVKDGIQRILTVPSTPLYAYTGTRHYERRLEKHLTGTGIAIRHLSHYYSNDAFIHVLADRLRDALNWLPAELRHKTDIIFVAHSMPGHPGAHREFIHQYEHLSRRLTEKVDFPSYRLTYRSGHPGSQKWLGPDVLDVIQHAADQGQKAIVACELLSIIENAEVIQEVGRDAQKLAHSLNMEFVQTEYLNDSDDFINVLEKMCIKQYASITNDSSMLNTEIPRGS